MAQANRKNAQPKRTKSFDGTLDWDKRYGDVAKYKRNAAIAHRRTGNFCCICIAKPSDQIHHAAYGRDEIGVTTFPVCSRCHEAIAHHPDNWIKDKKDPVWGNRNTDAFTTRLKLGYQLLYGGIER